MVAELSSMRTMEEPFCSPQRTRCGPVSFFVSLLPAPSSAIAMPVLAGGCTYAIGQVFVRHYESGGTLLTFNVKEFQAGFTNEVKAGMKKVTEVKI